MWPYYFSSGFSPYPFNYSAAPYGYGYGYSGYPGAGYPTNLVSQLFTLGALTHLGQPQVALTDLTLAAIFRR